MKSPIPTFLAALTTAVLLSQCSSLKQDCEAVVERDQKILQEPRGDYYIGRRYYVPSTRFWGYIRRPNQPWSTAKLVVMSEKRINNPDRGPEPPRAGATFGRDHNVEYAVQGRYTGTLLYDPNSNQELPAFDASSFVVRDRKPGFLFSPSEEYKDDRVSLFPSLSPRPEDYAQAGVTPVRF